MEKDSGLTLAELLLIIAIVFVVGIIMTIPYSSERRMRENRIQYQKEQVALADVVLPELIDPESNFWPDRQTLQSHMDTLEAPARLKPALAWIVGGPNLRCEGPVPFIGVNDATTRYLDRIKPNWREEEARVINQANIPFTQTAKEFRESAQKLISLADRLPEKEREKQLDFKKIAGSELDDIPQCTERPQDAMRARLYLTGLRNERLNRPAQNLDLSDEARADGLSDAQALCLSGTYNVKYTAFIAGETAVSPDGKEQAFLAEHPGLKELSDPLIVPADLRAAGCTLERQTELFSRIN